MQKIIPHLWFDDQAEEAAKFYTSLFRQSRITDTFTPAISFLVRCETQAEVDRFWDSILKGGVIEQCGWVRDKFGVSWQIVPTILFDLLKDTDRAKVEGVTKAMLGMKKLNINALTSG